MKLAALFFGLALALVLTASPCQADNLNLVEITVINQGLDGKLTPYVQWKRCYSSCNCDGEPFGGQWLDSGQLQFVQRCNAPKQGVQTITYQVLLTNQSYECSVEFQVNSNMTNLGFKQGPTCSKGAGLVDFIATPRCNSELTACEFKTEIRKR